MYVLSPYISFHLFNSTKSNFMKRILFLFILFAALGMTVGAVSAAAASTTEAPQPGKPISGKVFDKAGQPIAGAVVMVKGTNSGVMTDIDGSYSIQAAPGSEIEISCIGYETQTVKVSNANVLNVVLEDDFLALDESVVTAMGISRERKSLGYSVSDLGSTELMKNKNTNVINSLAGKVPGVNITQNSGAAGAGATITIRGGNSSDESRSNEPLFVVDGVIYDNSITVLGNSGTDGMTRSNTTYSNRLMDINPEDIETLSVLKGAAASALYGSRAADGVVIITTKKGSEGAVQVDLSSKVSVSWANKLPEVQTTFGRGYYENSGTLNDQTYQSWGEAISSGTQIYDNIGNFFQNGVVYDNNVSISGGSKNSSFYLSLSNYDQEGIVPETGYEKTTVRFNGEQKYGRLTVSANASYSISNTDKTLTSGGLYDSGGTGAMVSVYTWPVTEDMSHYLNDDGTKYRLFDGILALADDKENPYWIVNKDKIQDQTHRFTGSLGLSYKIADWWDISARLGYDNYTTDSYIYIEPGSVVSETYQNGRLSKSDYRYEYISTNVMSNMHKSFGDFDLSLLIGTTAETTRRHNQTHWGYDFVTPGTVSFSNIASENQFFSDSNSKKRLVGVYGEFAANWKEMVFLTVTGRNDWSSTLPVKNRSYFYPSVSGSFVFTEVIPENTILSFGKLRASWAQVGKDATVYATATYLNSPYSYGSYTMVGNSWTKGNSELKPEIQTSWEVGLELKFFNGLIGLDWTYYDSSTKNQIAQPRLTQSSGAIFTSLNSGSVKNKGMEFAITAHPISTRDWSWDFTVNASYNRGTLGEFIDGVTLFYPTDAQFGGVRAASIPNGGNFLALVGSRFYYEYDDDGNEIEGGRYQIDSSTGLYRYHATSDNEVLGNREPKMIGGFNTTLRWKNLTMNALFDIRIGGDVYNGTEYLLVSQGLSKRTLENGREYVTVSGVDSDTGEEVSYTYYEDETYVIGSTTYSGKAMIQNYWSNYANNSYNFITSVNWLKLRSLSFTYDFTSLIKGQNIIKRLSATVTGTNLFTWTNYEGMDPEVSTGGGAGGAGSTGIDYCSVPATSSFTFGVNLTF